MPKKTTRSNSQTTGPKTQTKPLCLNPGRQSQAGSSPADIVIYGGAAGGGKSHWLLTEAVRYYRVPGWVAQIFRRKKTQLRGGGGLWLKSYELYSRLGGKANNTHLTWAFNRYGSYINFGHMQHEHNMLDHQGKEYAFIGFDELDHFLESQFWYLFSRNRTGCGVRAVIRCTVNPNPDHFIKPIIRWWLDENGQFPDLAKAGIIRWFVRNMDGELVWHDEDPEQFAKLIKLFREEVDPDFKPTSLTFIPASVDDNPFMPKAYKARLMVLQLVERQRLLYGDWLIKPAAGTIFKKSWFPILTREPVRSNIRKLVRYWDRAATKKEKKNHHPDWTVGILMAQLQNGAHVVLDMVRLQGSPLDVQTAIARTAKLDDELYGSVEVALEVDPGQAGKTELSFYTRELSQHVVRGYPVKDSKIKRAEKVSAQAEQGNIFVLNLPWLNQFLIELEAFPDGVNDDIVDAFTGAYNALNKKSAFV